MYETTLVEPAVDEKIDNTVDAFPDENVPMDYNCFSYMFYKLGLDPEEGMSFGYHPSMQEKFFQRATPEEAETLALKHKKHEAIDHVVFIDRRRFGAMRHKRNSGYPIEDVTLTRLMVGYPPEEYEYVFLKKRLVPKTNA